MTKTSLLPKSLLCALAVAGAATSSQATLLVQESFNYGGSTIANINGTTETGTGLQGNWTVTNALPGGGLASSAYQTTGLSFGSSFAAGTGGALLQTTRYSGSNAQSSATVQLDITTTTGDIWGSYLVNYTTLSNGASGAAIQGIGTSSTGATVNLGNRVNTNATAGNTTTSVFYDSTLTTSAASTLISTSTTYMVLSKFTNVGTTLSGGSPGVATTWYFTQTGYESWLTIGGGLEANLSTYAVKSGSDTVTSGQINFDSNGFLTLKSDAPDINNFQVVAVFDEIRYGTTIYDVGVIPEPSATALLFGAGVSVLLFRRKRGI